jgi:AcrR family transcriptional regulator
MLGDEESRNVGVTRHSDAHEGTGRRTEHSLGREVDASFEKAGKHADLPGDSRDAASAEHYRARSHGSTTFSVISIIGNERYHKAMDDDTRLGRPRDLSLDETVLATTMSLLEEHGYDRVRMSDIATAAGVGLGAVYRRWPGKKELVAAALRSERATTAEDLTDDPREDLLAAMSRVCTAVDRGLGRIVAECLNQPGSEFAKVAVEAKLDPLVEAIRVRLARIDPACAPNADLVPAFILWYATMHGVAPSRAELESRLLPVMGLQ